MGVLEAHWDLSTCPGAVTEFCWMCMGPWKKHATEYYECSKYQANPQEYTQTKANLAREALKKYLHYYGRVSGWGLLHHVHVCEPPGRLPWQWHNHDKSLKLEEELLQQLNEKIAAKVSEGQSSWIDWQYIVDAAKHLTKVREGRGHGRPLSSLHVPCVSCVPSADTPSSTLTRMPTTWRRDQGKH